MGKRDNRGFGSDVTVRHPSAASLDEESLAFCPLWTCSLAFSPAYPFLQNSYRRHITPQYIIGASHNSHSPLIYWYFSLQLLNRHSTVKGIHVPYPTSIPLPTRHIKHVSYCLLLLPRSLGPRWEESNMGFHSLSVHCFLVTR